VSIRSGYKHKIESCFKWEWNMICLMPCRNPCTLYIHLAFTYSVGPSSLVWSELEPAPPFPPTRVLGMWWSHALNLMCEGALKAYISLERSIFFLNWTHVQYWAVYPQIQKSFDEIGLCAQKIDKILGSKLATQLGGPMWSIERKKMPLIWPLETCCISISFLKLEMTILVIHKCKQDERISHPIQWAWWGYSLVQPSL
jgi:hypothetical protein